MLERLEGVLRAAFEGVGRMLPGKLEPLELASELRQAMRESQTLSTYGTYVANRYRVRLNEEDLRRFEPVREEIEQELERNLGEYARENNFLSGPSLKVALESNPKLHPGHARVEADFDETPLPAHLTVIAGADAPASFQVRGRATVGRSELCDIMLADSSVSRQHAELVWTYSGYVIRDLNSTNGTSVNGTPITEERLRDGDTLHLGAVELRFACHAE